jgi:protein-S-isoprenylcysteine O-methyltransferase Ste14
MANMLDMTAIKTLLWSIFVPSTAAIVVPYLLMHSRFDFFRTDLSYFRWLGSIPILVGVILYIWSAWYFTFVGKGTPAPFDPPKELVIKGPYQYSRNPIYVFVALALIGEAVFFGAAILVLYVAVILTFLHLWVVLYEERSLKRRFGEPYERYCHRVSRWIP